MQKSKHQEIMKTLRKERKLSQTKIARELNMTQRMYSTYETGERTPNINTLLDIANFFNVTLDYLTGNETKRLEPLTEEERRIIQQYRNLNYGNRKRAEERISTLFDMQEEETAQLKEIA